MIRLHVIAEGQTEKYFVETVLAGYLANVSVFADARCVLTSKEQKTPYERIAVLEKAMSQDIGDRRFIPYIQLHEFETLILASPQGLNREYLEHEAPIARLVKMVDNQNPELIDDGRESAPSKRILHEIPEYDKATAGVSVAEHIGLPTLRKKCRHFHDWITKLEELE